VLWDGAKLEDDLGSLYTQDIEDGS